MRTFRVLQTGDPETDQRNVLDLYYENINLKQKHKALVAEVQKLQAEIEQLRSTAQPTRSETKCH